MKKKLLGILLCFCLAAGMLSGCGSDNKSTSGDMQQTDNGSESTETGSEEETQSTEEGEVSYYLAKEIYHTDCRYSPDGFHIQKECEYDASGNLIKEIHFRHDNENFNLATGEIGHVESQSEYEYDEAGRLLSVYHSNGNQQEYYEYDDAGKLISVTLSNSHSSVKTEYKYDEAGKLLTTDSSSFRTEYEYNEAGNLVKKTEYNGEGIVQEYEYDANGNEIKCTYYQIYQGPVTYVREYDADGNAVKEDEYRRGEDELTTSNVYEYDEKGRIVRRVYTFYKTMEGEAYAEPYIGEEPYSYEEEYDDAGNLIKLSNYRWDSLDSYIEYEYAVQ